MNRYSFIISIFLLVGCYLNFWGNSTTQLNNPNNRPFIFDRSTFSFLDKEKKIKYSIFKDIYDCENYISYEDTSQVQIYETYNLLWNGIQAKIYVIDDLTDDTFDSIQLAFFKNAFCPEFVTLFSQDFNGFMGCNNNIFIINHRSVREVSKSNLDRQTYEIVSKNKNFTIDSSHIACITPYNWRFNNYDALKKTFYNSDFGEGIGYELLAVESIEKIKVNGVKLNLSKTVLLDLIHLNNNKLLALLYKEFTTNNIKVREVRIEIKDSRGNWVKSYDLIQEVIENEDTCFFEGKLQINETSISGFSIDNDKFDFPISVD